MRKQFAAAFLLIFLMISSACSANPTPVSTPTATITPTHTSTVEPTQPAPTAASTSGYSYNYGSPAQTPKPVAAGPPMEPLPDHAYFQDHLATADKLVVNLNVEPAPANQSYQGWIRTDDGSFVSVGILEVKEGLVHLEWAAPDGRNLIASTNGFVISLEDSPGSSLVPGKVVYAGEMTPEQTSLARSLFVSNTGEPITPRNKAFALALVQQMDLASEHVKNAINAEAIGAARERTLHLEHVINILEGSKGERFKDYDGNGIAENPGDGFGVTVYAAQLAAKLNQDSVNAKALEVQEAILKIEQETIAILEDQAGAISLEDLRLHFDDVYNNQVLDLYRLSEQAVAFSINLISNP